MSTRPRLVVLLVALGVLGVLAVPAGAAERPRTVKVTGTQSDSEGLKPEGAECSVSAGGCRAVAVGHVEFAGGIAGRASYILRIAPDLRPDGLHYSGSAHFERVVTPCGTGAVDIDFRGVYQPTTFDPATHTTTNVEEHNVRVGSGTGGLAGVTGTWTSILRDHNDGKTDGRYSGFLTCPGPPTRH